MYKKMIEQVIKELIEMINPYELVKRKIENIPLTDGNVYILAIGKAAWIMAKAAADALNERLTKGYVLTKYGHSLGSIYKIEIFEAGHPILDENTIKGTSYILDELSDLNKDDQVIVLVSGGGSALFEKPLVSLKELQQINDALIRSSADINEINAVRKKLSLVKGGGLADHLYPAKINTVIISDVVGNDLSTIASGPTIIDSSGIDPLSVIEKYQIDVNEKTRQLLSLSGKHKPFCNEVEIICDTSFLSASLKKIFEKKGFKVEVISDTCKLDGEKIKDILVEKLSKAKEKSVFIIAGEASVMVKGNGLGGRNQHIAALAIDKLSQMTDVSLFTFGSDGTDGPTDAAGGYVDNKTKDRVIDLDKYLDNCDSYHLLQKTDGLIVTGPTGTNVCDVYVGVKW